MTYRVGGKLRRVRASGAINALPPTPGRAQVAFRLDYSGGPGPFRNTCGPYRGPALAWLVTACTAPDGSHWALQSWQRSLPNYGQEPTAQQAAYELRLSHWSGPIADLVLRADWSFRGRYEHVYGSLSYRGVPVHGFASTRTGVPLDSFGRNIYLDTYNSQYGPGWRRENSFLAHRPTGVFCYHLVSHRPPLSSKGEAYRATVIGPGVTPDVSAEVRAPGPYDPTADSLANAELNRLAGETPSCRPN